MRPRSWIDAILDGVFLFVLGCTATGAAAAVYHLIFSWRQAWRIW